MHFLKFIDFLIPKDLKADEDVLYKTRFLVMVSFFLFCLTVFAAGMVFGGQMEAFLFMELTWIFPFIPILMLWLSRNFSIAGNYLIGLMVINMTCIVLSNGGISFPSTYWFGILPIFTLLMIGLRSAILWSGILIALIFYIFFLSNMPVYKGIASEIEYTNLQYLYSNLLFLFFAGLSAYLFWNRQDKLFNKLKAKNDQLIKKTAQHNLAQTSLISTNLTLAVQNNKLAKTRSALMESNSALERYAHTVSHDLKEPLRSVRSFTQLLNRHYKKQNLVDDTSQEYFDFILKGTENMNRLISEMLKFSELSYNTKANFKEVDLNRVLNIVKDNLNKQIEEANIKIVYGQLPTIWALPIPIIQIFQNLISNAIKFRREEVPSQIWVIVEESKTEWTIIIRDNGIGIKEEDSHKIFDDFTQLHSLKEGQGIGLSTCQKIVEQHEGKIWLNSVYGQETSFHFTIKKIVETDLEDAEQKLKERVIPALANSE